MQPNAFPPVDADKLIDSAKGWHSIQLGVLGFIGFCGVQQMSEPVKGPEWLSWWWMGFSAFAFGLSLVSMWFIGGVAYPVYGGGIDRMPKNAPGRLRTGIRMAFSSILMMVVAALGGWWPSEASPNLVSVTDASGASACGTWVEGAPAGSIFLDTSDGRVTVRLAQVSEVRPVASC